ncbi:MULTISPECIES: hypothetical protein [unclassified Variovorax]|uniref:hypothetical protein n=1 Tax=unclassified Variovorax TaxID=663243 RepID=UPI00076DC264|nr:MULTISPECIES: hypothetical protein [unclassified Variovorax]KWT98624.1 hypothetical protein APY03_0280 [Variovorax sp. WDL1]PNG52541.1 hypothetical protein CHC07_04914 [Variovorax sp. B4]PNG55080.1 hypothetical protein CHC06_03879 [Variovorax sp. B2]VTV16112.1 hypothetical protein WDL1CHR_06453 [Variovorax sp. WDL1]
MARRLLVALLLALLSAVGHAACDTGLAERIHAKLHAQRALDHERAVCQPWRGFAGRFIVVLPLPRPSTRAGATQFDLDVLVVQQADNGNTDRATVVSRLFEPSAMSEDAVRIGQIKVDTARYTLASEARAFGLRIVRQGSSRVNPYSNETLTLYVPRGPRLAKVLDRLEVALERGEWDANCAGNFETVRSSVTIARSASNGYADLLLRQTRTETRSSGQGDECVTQERPAKFKSQTLRYDGAAYRAAKRSAAD